MQESRSNENLSSFEIAAFYTQLLIAWEQNPGQLVKLIANQYHQYLEHIFTEKETAFPHLDALIKNIKTLMSLNADILDQKTVGVILKDLETKGALLKTLIKEKPKETAELFADINVRHSQFNLERTESKVALKSGVTEPAEYEKKSSPGSVPLKIEQERLVYGVKQFNDGVMKYDRKEYDAALESFHPLITIFDPKTYQHLGDQAQKNLDQTFMMLSYIANNYVEQLYNALQQQKSGMDEEAQANAYLQMLKLRAAEFNYLQQVAHKSHEHEISVIHSYTKTTNLFFNLVQLNQTKYGIDYINAMHKLIKLYAESNQDDKKEKIIKITNVLIQYAERLSRKNQSASPEELQNRLLQMRQVLGIYKSVFKPTLDPKEQAPLPNMNVPKLYSGFITLLTDVAHTSLRAKNYAGAQDLLREALHAVGEILNDEYAREQHKEQIEVLTTQKKAAVVLLANALEQHARDPNTSQQQAIQLYREALEYLKQNGLEASGEFKDISLSLRNALEKTRDKSYKQEIETLTQQFTTFAPIESESVKEVKSTPTVRQSPIAQRPTAVRPQTNTPPVSPGLGSRVTMGGGGFGTFKKPGPQSPGTQLKKQDEGPNPKDSEKKHEPGK